METLLSEIEAFCDAQGIAPSKFGELAMKDKRFVFDLREGRRVWPETAQAVRSFMASFKRQAA
jgi:hypothetical protein